MHLSIVKARYGMDCEVKDSAQVVKVVPPYYLFER